MQTINISISSLIQIKLCLGTAAFTSATRTGVIVFYLCKKDRYKCDVCFLEVTVQKKKEIHSELPSLCSNNLDTEKYDVHLYVIEISLMACQGQQQ